MQLPACLVGLTLAVSVTIGIVSFSISHTFGSKGKTRVSYAVAESGFKAGQSTCINLDQSNARLLGCDPNSSKVMENFQSYNASPDPFVISALRRNDKGSLSIGVGTSVRDPTGWVRVGGSLTKSYDGKDALAILNNNLIQEVIPKSIDKNLRYLLEEPRTISTPTFKRSGRSQLDWVYKGDQLLNPKSDRGLVSQQTYPPIFLPLHPASKPARISAIR